MKHAQPFEHNIRQRGHQQALSTEIAEADTIRLPTPPSCASGRRSAGSLHQDTTETLTLKLTPLGKVPTMRLSSHSTDPLTVLAQFRLEFSTAL